MNEIDLYNESSRTSSANPAKQSTDMVPDSIFVYVDVTKPLPQLIEPIRNLLEDKPDNFSFSLYIVSGKEVHDDFSLFCDYLKGLIKTGTTINFYFRGTLHGSFIPLLIQPTTMVSKDCNFLYDPTKLQLLLGNICKENLTERFIQRFDSVYRYLVSESYLDISELYLIGLDLKKF